MAEDGPKAIDKGARWLGAGSLLVSAISAYFAWQANGITAQNRADAAERVLISITRDVGVRAEDVFIPLTTLSDGRQMTVPAKRTAWKVLVTNSSLSSDVTVIGIVTGQQYKETEPVGDFLSRIDSHVSEAPKLPLTLSPSRTTEFRLIADIPVNSSHIPVVQVSSSRGNFFTATPTP